MMNWLRLRYDVPNFKWDRRRKYGWRSFENFPKGTLVEVWSDHDEKPTVWFGTSQVEDKTIEKMLLDAGETAVATTFDEIKMIHGLRYTSGSTAGSTVIDYAMAKGWLTQAQIIEALTE